MAAKEFFANVVEKVLDSEGLAVVRVDLEPEGGQIYDKFTGHLALADVIVVDITGFNPNAMYELGHVHAQQGRPFIYRRVATGDDPDELPFYLTGHAIETVESSDAALAQLRARLRAHLHAMLPDRPSGTETVAAAQL